MLALIKTAAGPGNVALLDVPRPSPGPGQVLAEVAYAGICGSDLHMQDGDIQLNVRTPVVMGHEFSGKIAELGEGVEGWQVGQPIVSETAFATCGRCIPCRTGNENVCQYKELIGFVHPGVFTQYVVLPAHRVHAIPDGVAMLGAALSEPLASAVRGVLEQIRIVPGDVVVVAGPGVMGLLSLQLAKVAGATVVVTGLPQDRERLGVAARLGADRTVDLAAEDLRVVLRGMSHGEGADVYIECSGAPAAARMGLVATRRRGQYLQLGLSGAPFEIDFALIAYREIEVYGTLGQKWTAWERGLQLLSSGRVVTEPLATDVFPLTQWEEAFAKFRRKEGIKIVLTPMKETS
jgi:L-iditol 2-dehydrogenase